MRKVLLVAVHEYLKRVKKRSFLLALFGMPLLMVTIGAISALVAIRGGDGRPVGYIDHAGLLNSDVYETLREQSNRFPDFKRFSDEATARAALEAGELQAYYVIPEDYFEAKELRLVQAESDPSVRVTEGFEDFLRASLIKQQPTSVQARLEDGFGVAVHSGDGRRELSSDNILGFLLPFVVAFFMFFAVASSGGYLLEAVTAEKENRTMEILVTSLSPMRLMGGKALGLMSVSLTQILLWLGTLVIGAVIGARYSAALRAVSVPWELLIVMALYALPTFALIAGIMTSIGAAVTEAQQGQQISGIINLLFIMPVFFVALIMVNAHSPFLVALTLFPTTALITILLRWGMATVPLWQMIVSWVVLVSSAVGSVWVAGRVLRLGMLRYGQRLRLKDVLGALRGIMPALEQESANHA